MDTHELVRLRCATAVFREDTVLLLHRTGGGRDNWVLPGGCPAPGEGTLSCARRELLEETGLRITPTRCAFVLETIDPDRANRTVEIIFVAPDAGRDDRPKQQEPGLVPVFVALHTLPGLQLRPPIGGHLRGLRSRVDAATTSARAGGLAGQATPATAPFLGNLWRPEELGDTIDEAVRPGRA